MAYFLPHLGEVLTVFRAAALVSSKKKRQVTERTFVLLGTHTNILSAVYGEMHFIPE